MHLAKFISLGISKEIRSLVSSLVPDVGHPVSGGQACTIFVFYSVQIGYGSFPWADGEQMNAEFGKLTVLILVVQM